MKPRTGDSDAAPERPATYEATPALDGELYARRFWLHYLVVGILVFVGEAVAALTYLALTPDGPHRFFLITLTVIVILSLLASLPLARIFASSHWRGHYSFAWTLAAGVVLTAVIHLDRGTASPLLVILVLPIMSAALALEVRQVVLCGVATFAEFLFIWLDEPVISRSTSAMSMFSALLVGMVVIAVGVSAARMRLLSDETRLRSELATMATTDALTGCLNHGAFYDRLDVEVKRALRQHESLSLLMIDIDFFKAFNDTFGHQAGDDALAFVGVTLVTLSRSFDVVGRIGGDEFAVILPTSTLADAAMIATRMNTALTLSARPSVSIGYASLDPSNPTTGQLVRDADRSLYEMKLSGRGRASAGDVAASPQLETKGPPLQSEIDLMLARAHVRAADHAAAAALRMLDAYQATTTVGFGFVDRDFRIVRINPMLAAIHGGPASDQIGRTVEEVVPSLWPILEPLFRYVLDSRQPVINREVSGRPPSDPTQRKTWLTNLYPVTIDNELIGVGIVLLDITDWGPLDERQRGVTSRGRS